MSKARSPGSYLRRASHAGTWYSDAARELAAQLHSWLRAAEEESGGSDTCPVSAIIGPHAGFRYSGSTAAFAYQPLISRSVGRAGDRLVFIFGPSHHFHLTGCALSGAHTLETPIGNLAVATDVIGELLTAAAGSKQAPLRLLNREEDEEEHSLEMHLPMLASVAASSEWSGQSSAAAAETLPGVRVVPVMVGQLPPAAAAAYGAMFARYYGTALFLTSSDFCHYGARFDYTPGDCSCLQRCSLAQPASSVAKVTGQVLETAAPLGRSGGAGTASAAPATSATQQPWQVIETLDKAGMALLEARDAAGFRAYLSATGNTICGRNPILLLLAVMEAAEAGTSSTGSSGSGSSRSGGLRSQLQFVRYAQSAKVMRAATDSSVSYASALVTLQGSAAPAKDATTSGGSSAGGAGTR